jgi:putative ABC transport system permease protein
MLAFLRQIISVTMMNVQSIPQRAWLSIATIGSITMVVCVLLGFLAMAEGFRATQNSTGADDVAFILRSGADAELNSTVSREQTVIIETSPGIAVDAQGQPLVSPELYVIVDGAKPGSDTPYNLALRGVGPKAFGVRKKFALVEGRMNNPGTNEIIVGRALQKEFTGFQIGATVKFGPNPWVVTGVFDAGGSVFESEIWADLSVVQSLFNRGSSVQVVRAKLTSPAALDQVKAFNEADPRLKLDVTSESKYYADQAKATSNLILYLGWPLGIAMAVGALAGAINTMYSSVDARRKEIATLRAIGFNGFSAFIGTLVESMVLATLGGLIGVFLTYTFVDGLTASTGFTQAVFSFKLTIGLVATGLGTALTVGLLGGLMPAWRAARIPIVAAYQN